MARLLAAALITVLISICCSQNAPKPVVSIDDLIGKVFNTSGGGPTSPQPIPEPLPTKTSILTTEDPVEPTKIETNTGAGGTPEHYRSCGYEKECVPRWLCNNETIITDGSTLIDIRNTGAECEYLQVCCDIPNKVSKPLVNIDKDENDGCGYRNRDGVGYKISGDKDGESQFGEFPWMVAILREEDAAGQTLNLYECGGALIAPTVILTATHCVQNREAKSLVIRAGEWDTQTRSEVIPHQDRRVKEIIIHEKYNRGALFNDIALLIVDTPFKWESNIQPVCLPEAGAVFDHSRCYATGWGKDKFGRDGAYQVILKKIDLPIVPRDICQSNLRRTRLGAYFQLDNSFICAGGEPNKDTCKGDGGSPLVCPIAGTKDRYYQAGIVAWGVGCGEKDVPGVYANVPYLRGWIDKQLSSRNIDFSYFTP